MLVVIGRHGFGFFPVAVYRERLSVRSDTGVCLLVIEKEQTARVPFSEGDFRCELIVLVCGCGQKQRPSVGVLPLALTLMPSLPNERLSGAYSFQKVHCRPSCLPVKSSESSSPCFSGSCAGSGRASCRSLTHPSAVHSTGSISVWRPNVW